MTHLQQRLIDRNIDKNDIELRRIACQYLSAAIILAKVEHKGQNDGSYYGRMESNGDLIVLIVRDRRPVTIMYRRSSQTNTAQQMRVDELIDLSS